MQNTGGIYTNRAHITTEQIEKIIDTLENMEGELSVVLENGPIIIIDKESNMENND